MAALFKTPKMPKIEAPAPMPDRDDEEVQRARRRRIAKEKNKGGVQSTILSAGGRETLGG